MHFGFGLGSQLALLLMLNGRRASQRNESEPADAVANRFALEAETDVLLFARKIRSVKRESVLLLKGVCVYDSATFL